MFLLFWDKDYASSDDFDTKLISYESHSSSMSMSLQTLTKNTYKMIMRSTSIQIINVLWWEKGFDLNAKTTKGKI